MPQTVSEVRCQQPATAPVAAPPAADQWVGCREGACTLSEAAATWISDLLATLTKERKLRGVEHACLNDAEKKGLIQQ